MRYGRTAEPGFLPIYSVDSAVEARDLLIAACETNLDGEFVARELAQEQTLENLYAFGRRLADVHDRIKQRARAGGS